MVPAGARGSEVGVPRLVRVGRRAAEEPQGRHRLPRHAVDDVDARQAGRAVLLPPLLPAPGRPEHLQSLRAQRDPEDHGLLGAARRVGVPARRGAVHDREEGPWRRAPDGLQPAEGDARLPPVALRRRRDAGRSQRAAGGEPRLLRGRWRPAADDAQLRGQPTVVLRHGDRRHRAAGHRARGHAPAPAERTVGPVPPQPRRARSRPPDRGAAPQGVRRVRAGEADAALRSRHPPTPGADARQRSQEAGAGLQPAVLAAGHADDAVRRRDRHRRRPAIARA